MEQLGKVSFPLPFPFSFILFHSLGRPDAPVHQDIVLSGSHIEPEHCILTNSQNVVHLKPCSQTAMCYVNGKKVDFHTTIELTSGSRVIFGKSHVFRFLNPEQARKKNPKNENSTSGGGQYSLQSTIRKPYDYLVFFSLSIF